MGCLFQQFQCILNNQFRFALFQAARRGVVLPLLNQYGNFFHTHRIFRHYIWAAVLPITLLHLKVHWDNRTDLFHFWSVHARRIQRGQISNNLEFLLIHKVHNTPMNYYHSMLADHGDLLLHYLLINKISLPMKQLLKMLEITKILSLKLQILEKKLMQLKEKAKGNKKRND